jgi:hypothetical protein
MSQALSINPDIGLQEILRVSSGNDFDVVYNPLLQGPGNIQGGTFIKPAPDHEGATTTYDDPDALPGDVSVAQLANFQDRFESQMSGDMSGMNVLKKNEEEGGDLVLASHRAAMYADFAGNGAAVFDEGRSLQAAIDEYVQQSGDTLQLPSIY